MTQPEPHRGDVDTDDVLRRPGYDPERESGAAVPAPAAGSGDERDAPAPGTPAAPDIGRGTPEAPD